MNLKHEIEKAFNKVQVNKVVNHVGSSPTRFSELVSIFLAGPYRITQRASWPLCYCVERYPDLMNKHIGKIIKAANDPSAHDAVKRNVVRMLQFVDIPKSHQGAVADLCYKFLEDKKQAVAIRVFSMTVLCNLAQKIPELKPELMALIEDGLPYAKPAYVSRAKKVLKVLNGIPQKRSGR